MYTLGARCDAHPQTWDLPVCSSLAVTFGLVSVIEIECVIYGDE